MSSTTPTSVEAVSRAFRQNTNLGRDDGRVVVDIIIPVFGALQQTLDCLLTVGHYSSYPFRLVVIDDASEDAGIAGLLQSLAHFTGVVTISHQANRGFVASVNEGVTQSLRNDVVLLNSDTKVTAGWLTKLVAVAQSRPRVATVTPLTNNGTICSIPDPLRANEIPDGFDVDTFAQLIEQSSFRVFPEAPTGVGFCLYITRESLREVGGFDEAAFGRGYGEENDYCQRAIAAGFSNLIADHTFVYHQGSASFGDSAAPLSANLSVVTMRYPHYLQDVAQFCASHPLAAYHTYLRSLIQVGADSVSGAKTRVLHVLHKGGGIERHARDLAAMSTPEVLSYLALSDGAALEVEEYFAGTLRRRLRYPLPARTIAGRLRTHRYAEAFTAICTSLDIDLIHVHHLMFNDVTIADVARALGFRTSSRCTITTCSAPGTRCWMRPAISVWSAAREFLAQWRHDAWSEPASPRRR